MSKEYKYNITYLMSRQVSKCFNIFLPGYFIPPSVTLIVLCPANQPFSSSSATWNHRTSILLTICWEILSRYRLYVVTGRVIFICVAWYERINITRVRSVRPSSNEQCMVREWWGRHCSGLYTVSTSRRSARSIRFIYNANGGIRDRIK